MSPPISHMRTEPYALENTGLTAPMAPKMRMQAKVILTGMLSFICFCQRVLIWSAHFQDFQPRRPNGLASGSADLFGSAQRKMCGAKAPPKVRSIIGKRRYQVDECLYLR